MIITIDGASGTGKSTIAKKVAERLHFLYFDTGAMYRCFAHYALLNGVNKTNTKGIKDLLNTFKFEIKTNSAGKKFYFVNDEEVTDNIRLPEVSIAASDLSAILDVRKKIVLLQREFATYENTVFEGRDMGTIVFPNADLKIFFSADPKIRAKRRTLELQQKYPDKTFSYEEVLEAIKARDYQDINRKNSPLKQAKDAFLIDTSNKSIDEIVELVLKQKEKIEKKKHSTLYPRMKPFYWFILSLTRLVAKIFYRHKVYGTEHYLPGSGIIAANHVSFLDPCLLAISVPEEIYFLAKKELFSIPFLGWLIKKLNSKPVTSGASDAHVFKEILKVLKQNRKIILFPEGTRSHTGQMGEMQQGVAFLTLRAKSTIFPIYIGGVYKLWKKDKKWPKLFGKTFCVIGSSIDLKKFEDHPRKEAMEKITQELDKSLHALENWYEKGAKGSPP